MPQSAPVQAAGNPAGQGPLSGKPAPSGSLDAGCSEDDGAVHGFRQLWDHSGSASACIHPDCPCAAGTRVQHSSQESRPRCY